MHPFKEGEAVEELMPDTQQWPCRHLLKAESFWERRECLP